MRLSIRPPFQAVLFIAFLLVWGGFVGTAHRERVDAAEWWSGRGPMLLERYCEAFQGVRRLDRTLRIEEVERRALEIAGGKRGITAEDHVRLFQSDFEKIRRSLEDGEPDDEEGIQYIFLTLRFLRHEFEDLRQISSEADNASERVRLQICGEAAYAVFRDSADPRDAEEALGYFERFSKGHDLPYGTYLGASALCDLGRRDEAEARLRAVIARSSPDVFGLVECHLALAGMLDGDERNAESRKAFQFALGTFRGDLERDARGGIRCIAFWRQVGISDDEIRKAVTELAKEAGISEEKLSRLTEIWFAAKSG